MLLLVKCVVTALIGCKRCACTKPSLKYNKNWPPKQEIFLFFHSSSRTLMACQKNVRLSNVLLKVKTFFEITLF